MRFTRDSCAAGSARAGLDPTEIAIMDCAEKAADNAISAADIDTLRQHGLPDVDSFQVVLAVAARCFFSTVIDFLSIVIDAVGPRPTRTTAPACNPELQWILTVGRPIATDESRNAG